MSLHLGNDIVISSKQLLAILNLHKLPEDSGLIKSLRQRKGPERPRPVGNGRQASAVLCNKGVYYLSPIDATTLAKRTASIASLRTRRLRQPAVSAAMQPKVVAAQRQNLPEPTEA